MARITIIGGAGQYGSLIVREAANRGHEVTCYSLNEPIEPAPRVNYKITSIVDPSIRDEALSRIDVVLVATSTDHNDADHHDEAVIAGLVALAATRSIPLGIVSRLRGHAHARLLGELSSKSTPGQLDWFVLTPDLESLHDCEKSRRGDDSVVLVDSRGTSEIPGVDLWVVAVDEAETRART